MEAVDEPAWEARAADSSFWGGAGGASGADGAVSTPRGPRGSSTASRRVGCAPYCRLRGPPRPAGDRGAAETLGTVLADGLDVEEDS